MPGLEDNPKSTTPTELSTVEEGEPEPQPAVRELTQTDRINRQLLKSFLDRINTNGLEQNFQNLSNGSAEASSFNDSFDE